MEILRLWENLRVAPERPRLRFSIPALCWGLGRCACISGDFPENCTHCQSFCSCVLEYPRYVEVWSSVLAFQVIFQKSTHTPRVFCSCVLEYPRYVEVWSSVLAFQVIFQKSTHTPRVFCSCVLEYPRYVEVWSSVLAFQAIFRKFTRNARVSTAAF